MTDYRKHSSRRQAATSWSSRSARRSTSSASSISIYQFVSVTGRIVRQGHPGRPLGKRRRERLPARLWLDRQSLRQPPRRYLGYGPEAAELVGIPEPETFMQLPWDKRVARVFCTLLPQSRGAGESRAAILTSDCRGNLRRIHEQFKKEHKGLQLRHGSEPEMMWLKKDDERPAERRLSKPYCYHIDQFESLRPVFMRVIEYCRDDGPRHDPGRS